ncbi:uncharacterized protein F5891DRAFT_1188114 [Suillus fuscotomentosus]|uniref:Uncharacterized protein n=1 Tax=Suillus fuscotomentosus TaxID=1912939 RepID=A0AAD4E809_9AGAM|nr:uncharacterized protein F5891DRAFT_1188114 [Suillus fuscotomentosus]KAG1901006.1 hypothetical protein F5891DRAFT_1188114 [Suillus fuscotomentosus]
MFSKHQPKPTEKAKKFFQSVRKAVKHKQSDGDKLIFNKAKQAPVAAASDSKLEESLGLSISKKAPIRSKSYSVVIRSEDEEEELNHDADIIKISAPMSSNTSAKADESESETKCPKEDSEAEMKCLSKEWLSSIYAFFEPFPTIGHENQHHYHDVIYLCCPYTYTDWVHTFSVP